MNKSLLKVLNLNEGATKEEIFDSYTQLHAKYKFENNQKKLVELDHAYAELISTKSTTAIKKPKFQISTKPFLIGFSMLILAIAAALFFRLNSDSQPNSPTSSETGSDGVSISEEDLKPLTPYGANQAAPQQYIEAPTTDYSAIADSSDARLQITEKEKVDAVESFIAAMKKDRQAQNKIMDCYLKYQAQDEPGVVCAYMDAAAEYALNSPSTGNSDYFSPDAVTQRAYLHLYNVNNVSQAAANEHLKQIRFDVSQIVTDIELKKARRVGANLEQADSERTYPEDSHVGASEDDAVRAAQMAALPALSENQ